jgi:hypothetical protein
MALGIEKEDKLNVNFCIVKYWWINMIQLSISALPLALYESVNFPV